mmetsp:Transcript_23110/g.26157  ORF Transcript_23110/g.26157 Transcript_23110/m.26157 type:complete len:223 (+) Transcript_23110:1194-1862(+)
MCDTLSAIESYIQTTQKDETTQGTSFKRNPLKTTGCQCSGSCRESTKILKGIAKIVVQFTKPRDDSSCQDLQNAEYLGFCEFSKIKNNQKKLQEMQIDLLSLPKYECVYQFVRELFRKSRTTKEVAVLTLILLDRFREINGWELRSTTWRILFITAHRIAAKFEGQCYLANDQLARLYPLFSEDEFGELEMVFFRRINFHCSVGIEEFHDYFRFLMGAQRNA